ncbi:hypothetical protein B0O80DRAFT_501642 [Mortierella sp. GBAus27b]|nr:hypothetical protein B0O80DRAFT_501642 [Mortierella sp. GBAus27b]
MDPTQSFRLAGTTDILDIPCDQDDGQSVIYWDDILEVFPGVQYIKNGNAVVKKLKDHGPDGNKPVRIKHYPGVILDVVLSTSTHTTDGSAALSMITSMTPPGGGTNNAAEPVPEPIAGLDVIKDGQVSTLTADGYDSVQDISSVVSISTPGSQVTSLSMRKDSTAVLSLKQVVALSQTEQHGSESERQMSHSSLSDIQAQVLNSSDMHGWIVQAVQNGQVERLGEQLMGCLQDLKSEMTKNNELVSQVKELALKNNELASQAHGIDSRDDQATRTFNVKQDEMKKLQIQALDQLSLLQNRVQALMNQTYELHEYPIPRLFVVLPQNTSSWNPKDWVSNNFRLYFLCECGDHTRRSTSKIPHHIHLAKHEGYEITRPKEFFQQYGNYVLTILKMLKFGVSVAGVAIPAISHLIRVEALDQATSSLKSLTGNLQTGMEQAIGCLEKATADNNGPRDGPRDGASHQMENNEALEGADLRKLETFLKNKDGSKVLGNLYRTTTSEGHVKWVCIDHYRENYHEKTSKVFRDTVESMGGSFDENIGRVSVHIRSKVQADQFYGALEKAKSVFELDIGLDWDTTYNDFKKLRDCLIKTNVGAVHINLHRQDVPASDILNRGKRHDPILEIMRHPSTHSVSIVGAPGDFIRRSSLLSRNDDFSNLKTMEIDLMEYRKDIPGLKSMISKMSNLAELIMNDSGDKMNHVCGVCGATEPFQGSLNVDEDHVDVHVRSRLQAELASLMLDTSKSFYGLAINLQVDLNGFSTDTTSERIQRHDSILNIMHHTSTRSAVIIGAPSDFIQRSNLPSMNDNFPSMENLRIDVSALKHDISSLRTMISKMPKLVSLKVSESENRNHHVCGACDAIDSWEESFKVDGGRVKIDLGSRTQAEMSYTVLETTTSIHGLDIDLHVELKDGSAGEVADRIRGHDSVFDVMQHPSIHSVVIVEPPEDFIQQSNLLSRDYGFPGVKQLNIDLMVSNRDIPGLKSMVSRMPNLASLKVNDSENERNHVHSSSDTVGQSGKSFEVKDSRVTIHIRSAMQLDLVYQAFETIQSVYGLDIDLTVDMEHISTGDTSDRIQRHDAIFNIMRHPSAHSVTIINAPSDFIQHSSMGSRTDMFPGLKHVSLDLSTGLEQDVPGVGALVARMPNLSSLATKDSCGVDGTANPLKRPFEVNDNRVKIHLWSRIQLKLISHMLANIKCTFGLDVDLCVEPVYGSTGDNTDRTRGYDSIFDIMRHPSTHSVVLVKPPRDLIRQSSLLSKNDHFPHLKRLEMDLCMLKEDPSGIKILFSRIPNHTCVRINDSIDRNTQIQVGYNSMESSEEPIDGSSNHAKIHLGSIALRELTDELLARCKGAQEVDIRFYWDADESDLARLRDGLANTHVNGVKLYVNVDDSSDDGESTRIQRNNALFDMMGHSSIDSVTVMKPLNYKASRCDEFSNLKDLDINLSSIKEDISGLKYLLSNEIGGSLTFQGYVDDLFLVGLYRSIAEHQKSPIIFTFRKRRIPPIASHKSFSGHQYQSHLLSLVSIQVDHLRLSGKAVEEAAVDILVKLERGATGLKKLSLKGSFEERGDQFFKNVASVISRHKVNNLEIDVGGTKEEEGVRVLEWAALCKSFVASTSIRELQLYVEMTPSETESVLNSMDMSRLEEIRLRAEGYSSSEVDRVLDCLTNAHNLRKCHSSHPMSHSYLATQQLVPTWVHQDTLMTLLNT